ncbi:ABC transporter ATP-binding protein [Limobrevibacterium gyesilva]|uniref:ATP-binding cassette domain-containing protein n=1 Tax=Limobrevibacterium gyesilva TaxID=2991712 RepID=A0AA42CDJ8_9PROT|nr:oligopeptide/dipeptide ABC transporter ATP-binding protein [Limobrevibacterium gyesilva]MCW3473974.1 ATP-binding cassette domain-containing protein [Limobrevibacterium gyesilva]
MSAPGPLLRVRDLCVTFPARRGRPPVRAVDHVSFDIEPGQTLGLVGESGSGKTTTGRAILQLQPASGGSVRLLGQELTAMRRADLRAMRRHMQFVLQNPYSSLHPRMTVAQILAEPLTVHRSVPRERIPERVAELMTLVGMDPKVVHRYPHEFSGGQRQRVVIARALAVNPDFVVCDEPVSALDVRTQAQIVDLLHSLQEKLRLSYLFIAHDLAIVRAVAHRVAVMYGGRLVELGDAARVYDSPAHPYTRNLLDAVPIPDPARQRAKLAEAAPEPQFRGRDGETGPCVFGEDHAASGTPAWHEVAPGHGVSCRFWPPGACPGQELPRI